MHSNRALRQIANDQWGYFTARQAQSAGYTKHLQSYHARSGNWQRIDRALYRLPGYADPPEAEFSRWSLWAQGQCPERQVVLSHASALHYYGLQAERPARIDLTVSEFRFRADCAACELHLDHLAPEDVRQEAGFRITTCGRTLRDMRPDLVCRAQWLPAVAQALRAGLLTPEEARALAGAAVGEESRAVVAPAAAGAAGGAVNQRAGEQGMRSEREQRGGWRAGTIRSGDALARGRSFTLVEMLVVISIICILAGLLLPSLNRAVGTARQTQCANNLRQMYLAFVRYADDHNGELAYNMFSYIYALRDNYPEDFPASQIWSQSSGGRKIWHCPACPPNGVADSNSNGPADYGSNNHAWRKAPETSSSNATIPGIRITQAALRPAEKFLLADIGLAAGRPGFLAVFPDKFVNSLMHDGRLNMLFFDGHVVNRDDPYNICRWTSWGAYYAAADKRPFNPNP